MDGVNKILRYIALALKTPRICYLKQTPCLLFVLFTGVNGQMLSVRKLLTDPLHILSTGILPVGADKHARFLLSVLFLAAGKYHMLTRA